MARRISRKHSVAYRGEGDRQLGACVGNRCVAFRADVKMAPGRSLVTYHRLTPDQADHFADRIKEFAERIRKNGGKRS